MYNSVEILSHRYNYEVSRFKELIPSPQMRFVFFQFGTFLDKNDKNQIDFSLGRHNWDYSSHSNQNNESISKIHFYKQFLIHIWIRMGIH